MLIRLGRIARRARFGGDERGVAAIEFALIAPVMILMFFGMVELSTAVITQRRTSHATSSVGDLVAQYASVAPSDVADSLTAATWIMAPYSTSTLQLRVTSIVVDSSSTPRVNWSCAPSGQSGSGSLTPYAVNTAMNSLPANLVSSPGDSVIMSESTYSFVSPAQYVIKNALNFSSTFYFKPRQSTNVAFSTTPTSSAVTCNHS